MRIGFQTVLYGCDLQGGAGGAASVRLDVEGRLCSMATPTMIMIDDQ